MDNMQYAFFEMDEIFKNMPSSYVEKIPNKLKKVISENKISNGFKYNKEIDLDKQNVLEETKVFLSILYRLYWCSDESKKGKF